MMTVLIVSLTCSVMVSAQKKVSLGSYFASPAEVASMEKVIALFEKR